MASWFGSSHGCGDGAVGDIVSQCCNAGEDIYGIHCESTVLVLTEKPTPRRRGGDHSGHHLYQIYTSISILRSEGYYPYTHDEAKEGLGLGFTTRALRHSREACPVLVCSVDQHQQLRCTKHSTVTCICSTRTAPISERTCISAHLKSSAPSLALALIMHSRTARYLEITAPFITMLCAVVPHHFFAHPKKNKLTGLINPSPPSRTPFPTCRTLWRRNRNRACRVPNSSHSTPNPDAYVVCGSPLQNPIPIPSQRLSLRAMG